jgi:hypothetical protein
MAKNPSDKHNPSYEGNEGPPQQNEPKNHDDPTFDPARELGRQLARGIAFAAGKQAYDEAAQKHVHTLIEWIHSLFA